jgi:hypothetical protein
MRRLKTWKNGLYYKISTNKGIEIEWLRKDRYCPLSFGMSFNITHREDHAGIRFNLNLIYRELSMVFYDKRHWDYENNCWETYE